MINLIKDTNSFGYNKYILKDHDKSLIIEFENVGDLFIYFDHFYQPKSTNNTFTITKENYFIYKLFLELYTSIKNRTPYINSKVFENEENIKYQKIPKYKRTPFHDNIIDWYYDDAPDNVACRLIIEKKPNCFVLTITKSTEFYIDKHVVRIRNNGSKYQPYNIAFMSLYHNLEYYPHNYPYHQMHIEEYLYQQKKNKTKIKKK